MVNRICKFIMIIFISCVAIACAWDYREIKQAEVTAYCACERCCGKWADGMTASGHVIKPGDKFCAAPRNIPFGTMITIPGYGKVPVLDRGGAITEGCLDVYFASHQEALNWGRKHLTVRMAKGE